MPDKPIIKIEEKKPGGKSVIDTLIKRMGDMSRRSDDMSEAWQSIADYMRKEFKYEFSDANPAGWGAITAKYMRWKVNHGYPATIGVMTGALKKAMTSGAVVLAQPKALIYEMNENEAGYKGRQTGTYGKYFDGKRPIVNYVFGRVRVRAREAVRKIVKQGYDEGGK